MQKEDFLYPPIPPSDTLIFDLFQELWPPEEPAHFLKYQICAVVLLLIACH